MVAAINAAAFVASLGVNVHVGYRSGVYGNVPKMIQAIQYIGLTKVRDGHWPWLDDRFTAMAKAGIRFNFFHPTEKEVTDPAAFVANVTAFAKANPGAVVSLEGGNEVNFTAHPPLAKGDLAGEGKLQQRLFDLAGASPTLKDLPVYNLSLSGGDDLYRRSGALAGACTAANAHVYFGPGNPPNLYGWALKQAQINAVGRPVVITETGYPTAVKARSQGVDELTQAKQTLSLLMRSALNGNPATFLYELVDQVAEKDDPTQTNTEGRFGLFRNDWSPKPAAGGIRNMLKVLEGDVVLADARPGGLDYALSYPLAAGGKPPTPVYSNLFQRPDADYVIALWAEPDIWDEVANKPITAHTFTVQIDLPKSASWEAFDPLAGEKPVAFGKGGKATVKVCDHPILVRVTL